MYHSNCLSLKLLILSQALLIVNSFGRHDVYFFLKDLANMGDLLCYETCPLLFEGGITEDDWGDFYSDRCKSGERQSPINIDTSEVANKGSPKEITWSFFWHYDMSHATNPIHFDGQTVMIDGTKLHIMSMTVIEGGDSQAYRLIDIQFHWGKPGGKGSEHAIDGQKFDMEVQYIHLHQEIKTTTDLKETLITHPFYVLALFFEVDETVDSSGLQPIFDSMLNMAVDNITTLRSKTVNLNFFTVFPSEERNKKMQFYSYEGSYTAPDCDENVKWAIIYEPIKITPAQLASCFTLKTGGEIAYNNFRRLQDKKGRIVTEYKPNILVVGDDAKLKVVGQEGSRLTVNINFILCLVILTFAYLF